MGRFCDLFSANSKTRSKKNTEPRRTANEVKRGFVRHLILEVPACSVLFRLHAPAVEMNPHFHSKISASTVSKAVPQPGTQKTWDQSEVDLPKSCVSRCFWSEKGVGAALVAPQIAFLRRSHTGLISDHSKDLWCLFYGGGSSVASWALIGGPCRFHFSFSHLFRTENVAFRLKRNWLTLVNKLEHN